MGGQSGSYSLSKKCYQYDIDGYFLNEYSSISEAARAVQGDEPNLLKVLYGDLKTAYNYRWSFEKQEKLPFLLDNFTGAKKKIAQYDLNNNLVCVFDSVKQASRILQKSQGNISSAASGRRKTAYGYKWKFL